jgi:hypothetical protein
MLPTPVNSPTDRDKYLFSLSFNTPTELIIGNLQHIELHILVPDVMAPEITPVLPFFGQNCSLPFSLRSLDIPDLLKSWKKH